MNNFFILLIFNLNFMRVKIIYIYMCMSYYLNVFQFEFYKNENIQLLLINIIISNCSNKRDENKKSNKF